jgi:UDP-N-acetylmuramate dehydrogenase
VPLAECTTLRLGGPAAQFVEAEDEATLVDAVRAADAAGEPVLVLGGGSNLVVGDAGFAGTVVRVATRGVRRLAQDACGGVRVQVAAGESWDGFVASAVDAGWVGVEALAGIPGLVGATPIQNVGAYGQEVGDTLARVRVWDRVAGEVRTLPHDQCGLGYRRSRFKDEPGRAVVLDVTFQLPLGERSAPVRYAELARRLGVPAGGRAPLAEVRAAVLALRAEKGMILDDDDHDTWSAGSFFTNPVLPPERVPPGAPAWPQPDGLVKTSAAWLIEHAGFARGYPGPDGRVTLSHKHTLALTNRGTASTADLLELARTVRAGVQQRFGVTLVPEPVLVGLSL